MFSNLFIFYFLFPFTLSQTLVLFKITPHCNKLVFPCRKIGSANSEIILLFVVATLLGKCDGE
jgi:hypothetical protein